MIRSSRLTGILLGGLIFCGAGLGSAALGARPGQKQQKASPPQTTPSPASYWLSATTRNVYRVQIKGDTLVAYWVNVPKAEAQHGAYIRTECHRVGKKWVGTTRSFLQCDIGTKREKVYSNWCHVLTQTEISDVSAGRIVGRGEALKRFDCRQCMALEKEWKSFTWSPAELKTGSPAGGNSK